MPPEETPPVVIAPVIGALPEESEELADDVSELTEALSAYSVINEKRHTELLEGILQCQSRLEVLSTTISQVQATENPVLSQILSQLEETRAQLQSLKYSMDSMQLSPRSQRSEPEPEIILEPEQLTPESPAAAVEENPVAPTPQKRKRVIL